MKRIGITLDDQQADQLDALAALERTRPATIAGEVIKAYLVSRAGDIKNVLQARADYRRRVELAREQNAETTADIPAKKEIA